MEAIAPGLRVERDSRNVELKQVTTMSYQTRHLSDTISDIIGAVGVSGVLRACDHSQLVDAALDESLKEYERKTINRLLRFVRKGRIQIVDEIPPKIA